MLTEARQIRARQILSEHDTLMLLNFELSAYDECADCHFTSVKTVARDDGEMTETARNIAKQVLHEVRETYSIE